MIKNDSKTSIEFINDQFLKQFSKLISNFGVSPNSMGNIGEEEEPSHPKSTFQKIKEKLKSMITKSRPKQET